MNRRVVGLVVAIVLAAIATVAIYLWVQGAEDRITAGQELRQVYVATQRIEAGTSAEAAINQALIEQREVQQNSVAEGAIGSLEQIEGLVATVPIVPGQQIVAASFGDSASPTVAQGADIEVPEGEQAVSVDLAVVPAVAGFIDSGDHISIISLINQETGEGDGDDGGGPAPGATAQYLILDAEVLAVGQRVTTFDDSGNPTGKTIRENNDNYIFTLALTPDEIEKLVFAETQSTLWATLQRTLDEEEGEEFDPFTTPGANIDNLFQ